MVKTLGFVALALLIACVLAPNATAVADTISHRVAEGETLWDIGRLYGVSVDELAEANDISDPDLVFAGRVLTIPVNHAQSSAGEPPRKERTYEVRPGDTLSGIGVLFSVPIDLLRLANAIHNPDLIFIGQMLKIPTSQGTVLLTLDLAQRPASPQLERIIQQMATAEGIDPSLVKAVAWLESGWQQNAMSHTGAVGVMQIMPETAAWLEQDIFGHPLNEDTSVYDNVKAGVRLLSMLLKATNSLDRALASYYQGYGNTLAGVLYEDTLDYVETVRAIKATFWP